MGAVHRRPQQKASETCGVKVPPILGVEKRRGHRGVFRAGTSG